MILKYSTVIHLLDDTTLKTNFTIDRAMAIASCVCWKCQVAQLSIRVLG
ncbi:hypothetical protein Nmel_004497 [Mimus melanotis]